MKINTHIPKFTGFYHSIWYYGDTEYDEAYNVQSELDATYDMGDIADAICESVDYKGYFESIVKGICEIWEEKLQEHDLAKSVRLEKLWSPKEYNFDTDRIFVEVEYTKKQLKRLQSLFHKHEGTFGKWVKDSYTSYDGFMSYHSNDITDQEWQEWWTCEHKFMVIVSWILEEEFEEDLRDDAIYKYVMQNNHFCLWYSIEDIQNILKPYKASQYKCSQSHEPLNEYNFFDQATIRLANLYEKRMGKKPDVVSFESIKDEKFPWFNELSEEEQAHFNSNEDFYEAEEIYNLYK